MAKADSLGLWLVRVDGFVPEIDEWEASHEAQYGDRQITELLVLANHDGVEYMRSLNGVIEVVRPETGYFTDDTEGGIMVQEDGTFAHA